MSDQIAALDQFDFPAPADTQIRERFSLWATFYHVHRTRATNPGEEFFDLSGNPLGPKVPAREWCKGALEGTIAVEDERGRVTVFNHAGDGPAEQVNCRQFYPRFPDLGKKRWRLARGPFGDGVDLRDGLGPMILVPFRSIAVDGRQVPIRYKSLIFVPEARGARVTLPSGNIVSHDGYFFAADTGTGIRDRHIDFFGGNSERNPFPNFIEGENKFFDAFLIDNEEIRERLRKSHYGESLAE